MARTRRAGWISRVLSRLRLPCGENFREVGFGAIVVVDVELQAYFGADVHWRADGEDPSLTVSTQNCSAMGGSTIFLIRSVLNLVAYST